MKDFIVLTQFVYKVVDVKKYNMHIKKRLEPLYILLSCVLTTSMLSNNVLTENLTYALKIDRGQFQVSLYYFLPRILNSKSWQGKS